MPISSSLHLLPPRPSPTFHAYLKTCFSLLHKCLAAQSLSGAQAIHAHLIKTGLATLKPLRGKLLSLYSKSGTPRDCITLLKEPPLPKNPVSWNIAIIACFSHGDFLSARCLFDEMPLKNEVTWTLMVDGFMKCGLVNEAIAVLRRSSSLSVILWTAAISGMVRNALPLEALLLFNDMGKLGVLPNEVTFTSAIRAAIDGGEFDVGRNIVAFVVKTGFQRYVSVCNSLITFHIEIKDFDSAKMIFNGMDEKDVVTWTAILDAHVKDGDIKMARKMFDEMPEKNSISWSTMVARYYQDGDPMEAIKMFGIMHRHGFLPTPLSLSPAMCAAGEVSHVLLGRILHGFSFKLGANNSNFVSSALIKMYCECKQEEEARQVFEMTEPKNLICWHAMVSGYCENGSFSEALILFKKMPEREITSWNCIIAGLVSGEEYKQALEMFIFMLEEREMPCAKTFSCVLSACAACSAHEMGSSIHAWVVKLRLEDDVFVGTAMTDMYAKSGNITAAKKFFSTMKEKDEASWSAVINGLAANGLADEALLLFNQVEKPSLNLYLVGLSACAHSGFVEEGLRYFGEMKAQGFVPLEEHYACLVDLLAKAGRLKEAERIAERNGGVSAWGALLSGCRGRGATAAKTAERAAARLREIEMSDPRSYVLLSNVYSFVGRWEDAERVRALMGSVGSKKTKGASWVGEKGRRYEFSCGHVLHERGVEIHETLELLMLECRSKLDLGESSSSKVSVDFF